MKLLVWLCLLMLMSCLGAVDISEKPTVSFVNIQFEQNQGIAGALSLTIQFEDSDGDVGLNPQDVFPPFQAYNVVIDGSVRFIYNERLQANRAVDSTIRFIKPGQTDLTFPLYMIDLFSKSNQGIYALQEASIPLFNCRDFIILPQIDGDLDTILIAPNPNHINLHIIFYRKTSNGLYVDITPQMRSPFDCSVNSPFSGRIPIIGTSNLANSQSVTYRYQMVSSAFTNVFRQDTIMIEFYIQDRKLNMSNIVNTPDFVLRDIAR